jgi:hypothetical protein
MKSLKIVLAVLLLFAVGSVLGDRPTQRCADKFFYLTPDLWMGWQVHEACADGYHFASALELLQVSNYTYNTRLGATGLDSGYGPPTGSFGWLRTGGSWYPSPGVYTENCENWTSMDEADFGLIGNLYVDFEIANGTSWSYGIEQCIDGAAVWCVSDPSYPQ